MEKVIYLEAGDDVVSVIEKIQNEASREIVLVIPKRSTLTRSVINFKIVKDEANLLKKKISIATSDKLGQKLAIQAGLSTQDASEDKNQTPQLKSFFDDKSVEPYSISDLRDLPHSDAALSENEILEIKKKLTDKKMPLRENPSIIGHIQVSDIIRKSHTVQTGPEKLPEKKIGGIIQEKPLENNVFPMETAPARQSPRSIFGSNFPIEDKKTVLMVSSSAKKIALAFIAFSFAIAGIVLFVVLPKANVSVVPKVEPLIANVDMVVDPNIASIDTGSQKIPGKIITASKEKTQEFSSTGKKQLSDKAHGIITVYNEWSTNPQVLVENTRFTSKEGKVFRSKKTIVIPGMERVDGQDVPGTNDVEVDAQEPGESYNIEAASFTIPGFLGTIKYSTIYGRSKNGMTGGSIAEVQAVTATDISSARDAIIKTIGDEIVEQIKKDIPVDFKITNESIQTKIDEFQTDAGAGDVKNKFTAKVTATSTALIFSEKDANMLIDEIIKSKPSENKLIMAEDNETMTYGTPSFDKDGKMMLAVHIEKKVAWKLDVDDLKQKIKGKNKSELNGIFGSIKGIDSAKVWFEPFGLINTVPNNESRINISIDKNN